MAYNEKLVEFFKQHGDEIQKQVRNANLQAEAEGIYILDPYIIYKLGQNTEYTEQVWQKFNEQPKHMRRKADWITLQYYGVTNQDIYDTAMSNALASIYTNKFEKIDNEYDGYGSIEESGEVQNFVAASDNIDVHEAILKDKTPLDIALNRAALKDWVRQTGIIVMATEWEDDVSYIVPYNKIPDIDLTARGYALRALETRWLAFNMMPLKKRRESDWKMLELVGVTNIQYYLYYRSVLTESLKRSDIHESVNESIEINIERKTKYGQIKSYIENYLLTESCAPNDIAETLINIDQSSCCSFDDMIIPNIISDVINQYDGLTQNVLNTIDVGISDLPAYTPDEMLDLGVFGTAESNMYGIETGFEEAKDWFEEFCAFYQTGIYTESLNEKSIKRIAKLRELCAIADKDDKVKQQILEYGWNPSIDFTEKNRAIADATFKIKANRVFSEVSAIINVNTDTDINLHPDETDTSLKPIYIVLESGNTPGFSAAIKHITDSIYSHAMISFDSTMTKLYSFGVNVSESVFGGFIVENLYDKPKDAMIKIYTVFVKNDAFDHIKNKVEWFIENQKKTHYSWKNIFKFLFNIPSKDKDTGMICSQFVDRLFKLVNIDFTKAPSSLVSPASLDRAAKKNKHIYTCFSDKISKFKKEKLDKIVNRLLSRAKPIKEELDDMRFAYYTAKALNEEDFYTLSQLKGSLKNQSDNMKAIYEHIITPYLEARDIPVEIKGNGDLIIRFLAPGDFEAAFSKSNKLLHEYKKSDNIEGMKNEISYLWYLNILIEKKLHNGEIPDSKRKALVSARAHILGSFKEYLAEIQKEDKTFNFSEYFDNSKYSDSAYKISGTTISGIAKLIKNLV